jgi:hypothetical protein
MVSILRGSQRSRVTIVFRNPTAQSSASTAFDGLVRPEQVLVALRLHTGSYKGLVDTGSKHLVMVPVFMPNVGFKISCACAVMP